MNTAKRFDNDTVVKADKWSMVQFFSAGKKLDTKGARGLLKATPEEVAEHPAASQLRDEFLALKEELQKAGRVVDGEITFTASESQSGDIWLNGTMYKSHKPTIDHCSVCRWFDRTDLYDECRRVQYGRHVDFVLPTGYHVRSTLMMASLMAVDPMTESSINPSHDFTAFIGHPQSA